jgi:hypothetical protein
VGRPVAYPEMKFDARIRCRGPRIHVGRPTYSGTKTETTIDSCVTGYWYLKCSTIEPSDYHVFEIRRFEIPEITSIEVEQKTRAGGVDSFCC